MDKIYEELIYRALEARKNAYCPYSNFAVGAAVLTKKGKIYTGCNVENASYPNGICAERTAISKAISEGERDFVAVAIASASEKMAYPCGMCRQFINEFASDELKIYLVNNENKVMLETFNELFPHGFSRKDLN